MQRLRKKSQSRKVSKEFDYGEFENPTAEGDGEFENPTAEGDGEFENPTAEGDESPRVGAIERPSAFAVDEDEGLEPDQPPSVAEEDEQSPPASPTSAAEGIYTTGEVLDLHEHTFRRGGLSYTLFFLVSVVLLLGYGALFWFLLWVYYLVPNQLSAVGVCVAGLVPLVQYFGLSGARKRRQSQLQFYAFLAVLAVALQLSVVLVVVLDTDDVLTTAYLDSCAIGARQLCRTMQEVGELPFGVSAAEMTSVCACVPDETLGVANVTQSTSESGMFTCLRRKVEERFQLEPYVIAVGLVCTLVVEILLGFVAYNMMKDIDVREAKKDAKIQGGAATGRISGIILGGLDLRSAEYNEIMKKRRFGWRKKPRVASQRYAVLSLNTPGLHPRKRKRHILQTVKTASVEDDATPIWDTAFGGQDPDTDIWTYAASQALRVDVFDEVDSKGSAVLVGSGDLEMDGGLLSELDIQMDGKEVVDIPLVWNNPEEGSTKRPAGSVSVKLVWFPSPNLHLKTAMIVTKTWYFESTVLGMVFLSMIVLALQSPAAPPSLMGIGTLRILEIFVATHLGVELFIEIVVMLAEKGESALRDPWILLSCLVLACNWLSIIAPSMPLEAEVSATANAAAFAGDRTISDYHNVSAVRSQLVDIDYSRSFKRFISVGRVFRIVRPIRTLRMIQNMDIIVRVIAESAGLFITVCGLLVFLMAIFSLVGMSSFAGALQYECIGLPDDLQVGEVTCSPGQESHAADMEVECPVPCPMSLKCSDDHSWCAPLEGGPRIIGHDAFGFRDFDNFWRAMVTMFVQTTGDGGMHTIPLALHEAGVQSSGSAWTISFCASVCLNLIALNLFLAVCCSAYSDVASQMQLIEIRKHNVEKAARKQLLLQETEEQRVIRVAKEQEEAEQEEMSVDEKLRELDWATRESRCSRLRQSAKVVILSEWFERMTSLVILGNTVTMALVHKDMSQELKDWLSLLEMIFLVCFILEACAKFLGTGSGIYFSSSTNRFDLFVIIGSVLGYIATFWDNEVKTKFGLNVEAMQSLRAVRLLRALQIVRLLHRQKALILVLKTIFQAWRPLFIHTVFCVFSVCMFSIIGMHTLGGSRGPGYTLQEYDRENPANFETFWNGALTVFEMTVGEEWSHSMYWYARQTSDSYGYAPWAVQLFFIVMYVWMNCVLFSLYVAMLLDNFSVPEADKVPTQKRIYDRKERASLRTMKTLQRSVLVDIIKESKATGHAHAKDASAYEKLRHAASGLQGTDEFHASHNKSLYIFTLDSHIRLAAAKIQASKFFKHGILALILFSCLSLALEGAGQGSGSWADQHLGALFEYLNIVVLGAFVLEAGLKSIIHGFVLSSGPTFPYLSTKMNRLDFVIILLCLGSYLPFTPDGGAWTRALRLVRVITPMLNLTKNPEIKLVFISFVRAGPSTAVVLLPLVLMAIVFAILGVATFQGVQMGCAHVDNLLVFLKDDTAFPFGNETLCSMTPGYVWRSPSFNFDNSMRALASLTSGIADGAHGLMLETTQTNNNSKIFWILFHLVFSCFFVNLFIGVLSASFEKSSGSALATVAEKQWHALQRALHTFRPIHDDPEDYRPDPEAKCRCGPCAKVRRTPHLWWRLRSFMFTLAINENLEQTWRLGIIANTITLASDRFPTIPAHRVVVEKLNLAFLCICTAEVVVKMLGFGLRTYFSDGWLISDFVLVSISISMRLVGVQSGVEVLRVMRVFRMFVLASKFPSLVALIDTVIQCLKASMALVLITSLIVYLYAILGMNFFGMLPTDAVLERFDFTEDEIAELRLNSTIFLRVCPQCSTYSDYTNFSDFFRSLRLLMQCVFGQGIGGLIIDMEHLGAHFWWSFAFLASFFMFAVWVCMNLLIVTVLSNFDAVMTDADDGDTALAPIDFDGFAHAWAALTVGVHGSIGTDRTSPAILEHLSKKLQEECIVHNTEFEEPSHVNFENGDQELVGTLAVYIQRADGLLAVGPNLRPYARMTTCGSNATSSLKMSTSVKETSEDGNCVVWDSIDRTGPNEDDRNAMKVHITGFHTHLDFEVIDGFQFCDDLVGGCTVSMEEIRDGCKEGSGRISRTMTLMGDTTFKKHNSKPGAAWKRWERYASFVDEDEALEEEVADTDVENPIPAATDAFELEPVVALTDKQKKKLKKEQKRKRKAASKAASKAAKAERKFLKKKAKAEKREAKRRLKLRKKLLKQGLLAEEEEEDDQVWVPEPHRFHRDGWKESGVTITISFEFEPKLCLEKTYGFLQDYSTRYAHMESNAGIEGWLEVSEGTGPFKPRFCYIQQYPFPCFKYVRDAANVDTLQTLGLRNNVKLCTVPGSQMLSLFSGHDKKSATTTRKNISFQMVSQEDSGTGRQEEAEIGMIGGTVIGASGLQTQQDSEGVLMVEEVKFGQVEKLDGGAVIAAYVPQSASTQEAHSDQFQPDGNEQQDDKFEDEENILELQSPVRYMAVRRTTLRNGSSLESERRGHIKRGEIVTATHSKMLGSLQRIRCEHGWCSTTTVSGRSVLVISEDSKRRYYRAIKNTPIGADVGVTGKPVSMIKKGDVVEALEYAEDSDSGVSRIRVSEGWISEVDTSLSATIDPYCVIRAVPVGGWPTPSSKFRASGSKESDDDIERSRRRAAQSLRTHVVENNTGPEWNHDFQFKVFPSSWKMVVSVFDANSRSDTPIGVGEVEYGKDDDHSIPGKTLSGSGVGKSIGLSERGGTLVQIQLTNEHGTGKVKAAGSVMIEMTYAELIAADQLVAAREQAGGNFHEAMMVNERAEKVYRFRCMNSELRRSWLAALRWVATGCPPFKFRSGIPDPLPSARVVQADVLRVENDISLVDLPFCRSSMLVQSLYNRRVMGAHKPTLRWLTYVVFNLETFGWSQGSQQLSRKKRKQLGFNGVTLNELRGLNFHLTLERLCLLHYGKAKCLSYDQQMHEYRSEVYHCSMHLVCSVVGWWVARRRIGKTVGSFEWPWDSRFKKYPNVYKLALEGACASRVRCLVLLRKCIETRGRPDLIDAELPSRVRLAPKAPKGGGMCSCSGADSAVIVEDDADDAVEREDIEAVFHRLDLDGSGSLDRKEVKEALTQMLGDVEEDEIDRMVRAMDKDLSGEICMDEFVDAMMNIIADPNKANSDDDDSDLDELQISLNKLQQTLLGEVHE